MDKFIYGNKEYNCIKVDPSPKKGFNFPFTIIIPDKLNNYPELIYAWTLSGGGRRNTSLDNIQTYEEILEDAKTDTGSIDNVMMHLFKKGNPMILPVIPKIEAFRPNFLGSDIFNNDFSKHDENGNATFILDKNGNYTSKFNMFTDEEVNILNRVYGTKCIDRFKKQEKIFNELELNVECYLYSGNHRTIFNKDNIGIILRDIDSFIGSSQK